MIVLGIDPGSATTGYGVVRADRPTTPTLVECGVIRTRARDPLPARLRELHEGIVELIRTHRPDTVSVEDIFYAHNVRTTVILGHARGVILLAAAQANVNVAEYSPAEIKKAVVGTGAATKAQVQFMITRLLRLKSIPTPSDAADGIAAALTCVLSAHMPRLDRIAAERAGGRRATTTRAIEPHTP